MAQLVASMSGVVLGGVVMVMGSNLARGKIFTASIGSVDSIYLFTTDTVDSLFIYIQHLSAQLFHYIFLYICILGQVWWLFVLIPYLCHPSSSDLAWVESIHVCFVVVAVFCCCFIYVCQIIISHYTEDFLL